MSGSNIVPMPNMMSMWSSSAMPAGCCPPSGMTDLMKCYCDIQAATAFISKVVTDLAANDPAFQKALVDGIVASGSNIPLIGVTNGTDAQPGQVGEWVAFAQNVNFPTTANFNQTITMGVLQPGDWDCQAWAYCQSSLTGLNISVTPQPVGFTSALQAFQLGLAGTEQVVLVSPNVRALTSVPTLIPMLIITNQGPAGPAAGSLTQWFTARRRR